MAQSRIGMDFFVYLVTFLFGIVLLVIAPMPSQKPVELFIFFALCAVSIILLLRKIRTRKALAVSDINSKINRWTVLVVDDDFTFVKLVKSYFLKKAVAVISAETGERGLEMAKRHKPDLIILDVILPGMKGREVCAKLKEDSATENIPVVFVTFKNSLDDISAEMELGAVMHLTKPINYGHLYDHVYKILNKA